MFCHSHRLPRLPSTHCRHARRSTLAFPVLLERVKLKPPFKTKLAQGIKLFLVRFILAMSTFKRLLDGSCWNAKLRGWSESLNIWVTFLLSATLYRSLMPTNHFAVHVHNTSLILNSKIALPIYHIDNNNALNQCPVNNFKNVLTDIKAFQLSKENRQCWAIL